MSETVVKFEHVSMEFPGVLANDDVSLEIKKGEVFALVGENGAGKSTLMNILYGINTPTNGEVYVKGRRIEHFSPKAAIERSVGMVHQHFMLVPSFTVAQNIVLSREPRRLGVFFDNAGAERETRGLVEEYGLEVDPAATVRDISVGLQQRVEILKTLYRGADILILDEPTAVLTPQETEKLFGVLRRMRDDGKAIIIITHKLHEVLSLSDRVSVLCKGKYVGTVNTKDTSESELTEMMVGKKVVLNIDRTEPKNPEDRLVIRDLSCMSREGVKLLDDVTFTARAGEILGIAGIAGSGQRELLEAIAGLQSVSDGEILYHNPKNGKTEIALKGKIRTILLPAKLCRKLLKFATQKKTASGAICRTKSGKAMSRYQIWSKMKKLCVRAGVDAGKVFPHNLRHLFATAFYRAYKDIVKLADVLGHSSIETTRIYLVTSAAEHRRQLEQLKLVS